MSGVRVTLMLGWVLWSLALWWGWVTFVLRCFSYGKLVCWSFAFFLESLIVYPIRAEKVKHQRSHFWTLCRIFGRLLISALGTVFNDNLTSRPEHAIMYSEVINITFVVNSKKLLRTFP